MNTLENKLENILKKLKKPGISLQEANDLYFEAKKIAFDADKEEHTKQAANLMAIGIHNTYIIGGNFFNDWQEGKVEPTDHELNLLDKMADEFLDIIPKLAEDEIFDEIRNQYKNINDYFNEVVSNLLFAKKLVESEKSLRKKKVKEANTAREENTNREKSAEKNENNSLAEKLQQQIDALIQLIVNFQTQIQELEKKLTNSNSPEIKEKQLIALKQQQQLLQKQLDQKQMEIKHEKVQPQKTATQDSQQNQSKETSSTQNQTSTQNQDKFNWMWVVIPMGGGNNFTIGNSYFPVSEKEAKSIKNIYDGR